MARHRQRLGSRRVKINSSDLIQKSSASRGYSFTSKDVKRNTTQARSIKRAFLNSISTTMTDKKVFTGKRTEGEEDDVVRT
jgi:hypothetical protein